MNSRLAAYSSPEPWSCGKCLSFPRGDCPNPSIYPIGLFTPDLHRNSYSRRGVVRTETSSVRAHDDRADVAGPIPTARSQAGPDSDGKPGEHPNLLLIIADDHGGGTLGIEGDPRRATPNLDAMAREGVLFERAYCNSPLCTPSRQSLITGKLPHAVGVTQLETRLSDDVLTMGEWFRDLDYRTAAIGKMHFNGPSTHGFAMRLDTADWLRRTCGSTRPGAATVGGRGGRSRTPPRSGSTPAATRPGSSPSRCSRRTTSTAPSSISSGSAGIARSRWSSASTTRTAPSTSRGGGSRDSGRRTSRSRRSPTATAEEQPAIFASLTPDEVRGIQAAYYTSLSFVDAQVGRLIRGLDESKLSERTLVVYVGDNGYMLGQHGRFEKHCFYEPAVRIPMIVRWPGHAPRRPSHRRPGRDGRRPADDPPPDATARAAGLAGDRPRALDPRQARRPRP